MTSSRLRPRLRLGPVDGHDEDFDPLLGRTARDSAASLPSLASASGNSAPAPGTSPAEAPASVFDEPDQAGPDGELPPVPAPVEPPPAPPAPTISWQPVAAGIPVRRLPSQPPGKGLFVFRNPWRDGPAGRTPPPQGLQPSQARAPDNVAPATPAPQAAPQAAPEPVTPPQAEPPADAPALAPHARAEAPELIAEPVAEPMAKPVAQTIDEPGSEAQPAAAEPLAAEPVTDVAPAQDQAPSRLPPELQSETPPEPQAETQAEPDTSPRWPFGVGAAPASSTVAEEAPAARAPVTEAPAAAPDEPRGAPPVVAAPVAAPVADPAAAPVADPVAGSAVVAVASGDVAAPPRPRRPRPAGGKPGSARKGAQRRTSRAPAADARRAAGLPPLWTLFAASFLAGSAALMTGAALAAPLGGAFQLFSDHLMYLMVLPLVALGLWIAARQIIPALLTALVLLVQGVIVVPSLGSGPVGGDTRTTVGWASLAGSQAALESALREADRQEARLLLLGDAPDSLLTAPPEGWIIAARPTPGDGAAITILSRGGWRAANVAGEPAMARTEDNSVTVIGVNPPDTEGDTRARDAEINRSAARAGVQTTPTLAIGSFGVVPWNGAIGQFTSYGNVTRVRCGGLFGATQGLLAVDHAFVRGIAVTGCRTTGALAGSGHRPIWIRLGAPEAAPQDGAGD